MDDRRPGARQGRYAMARPLLITALSCGVVYGVLAALTAWPNALVPNGGYAASALRAGELQVDGDVV